MLFSEKCAPQLYGRPHHATQKPSCLEIRTWHNSPLLPSCYLMWGYFTGSGCATSLRLLIVCGALSLNVAVLQATCHIEPARQTKT